MGSQVVQLVIDTLSIGSLYALLALGIALVFGIMGLINFAHGELIMAAGYTLIVAAAVGTPGRLLLAILVAGLLALLMERIAFRPLRGAPSDTLLVASFGLSFFIQGIALVVFGSLPRSTGVLRDLGPAIEVFGYPIRRLDIITVGAALGLLTALAIFLKRTDLGVQMRAAAEDFNTARLLGVRANRVVATAFGISGLLAGVATIIFVAQTGLVTPQMGVSPVLAAFVATIIGGLGTLVGAVLGAYVLGAITVLLQVFLPDALRPYRDAFVFAILVGILIYRPQGLMGRVEQRV